MFRWYRRAIRCYVYLADVSTTSSVHGIHQGWLSEFKNSAWFARGWTLQELLAPKLVEFFSCDHVRLGDKQSLVEPIHSRTGIQLTALRGKRLTSFTDHERFSWIERRKTTVEEDMAYSLLGIFDVSIPIRYGEGKANAFKRLEDEISKQATCVRDLYITDPRMDKKRIEDTKGGLLQDTYCWILQNRDWRKWRETNHHHLLWVKGDSGKGKTMLLCGIIDELESGLASSDLVAYFFCQATDSRINSATAVLRGLLYLLVDQQPSLISHLQKRYDRIGKTLFEGANAWFVLSEVLTDILQDRRLETVYMIVDALDECVVDLDKLLGFIQRSSSSSSGVKWLVSSRNWLNIAEQLEKIPTVARLSLELNSTSVATAVGIYIRHKVESLAVDKRYDLSLQETVLDYLSVNSQETFLWVALVCQGLRKVDRRNVRKTLTMFPPGLNQIYQRMMNEISHSDDPTLYKEILSRIVTVHRPITLAELVTLVEALGDVADDVEALQDIISGCGSFLTVREDRVFFVHQSAKDYLLTEVSTEIFPSGIVDAHFTIFVRSLKILVDTLQQDIYQVNDFGYSVDEVTTPDPDPLAALQYSCIYWIDHACDWILSSSEDSIRSRAGDILDKFFRESYLYWLEALSICKSMSKAVNGLAKLESLLQVSVVS